MSAPLLPPNASALERAFCNSVAAPAAGIVPNLWNADTCPKALLPWLAWALSVDEWDAEWGEDVQRAVIRNARAVHQIKGTPAAIQLALAAAGQPDALVIERAGDIDYNGASDYDGSHTHGGEAQWATFKVVLKRPITLDQAPRILRMINHAKRNCCHLYELDFTQAALRHNNTASYNGSYTHGTI